MTEQPTGAEAAATLMGDLLLSCSPKLSVVWRETGRALVPGSDGRQWSRSTGVRVLGWETEVLCCSSLLGQARVELVAWELESGGLERGSCKQSRPGWVGNPPEEI